MKRSTTNFTFFLVVTMLLFYGCTTQQNVKKVSANEYALTPEGIARTHFEMLKNKQWIEIAHLFDPDDFATLVWLGHLNDLNGNREEGLKYYNKALENDTGETIQHDQFGLKINRKWVEERLLTQFIFK